MKDGRIATLGQFDAHFFVPALFFIIAAQTGAQPPRLHANDRIRSRVERGFSVENFHADRVFLEVFATTRHCFFNNITEKSLEPVHLRKCGAGQ